MSATDCLEKALHASLQPVDPGGAFTAALRTRLAQADPTALAAYAAGPEAHAAASVSLRARRQHSALLALAASTVMALSIGWQLMDQRAVRLAAQARVHEQLLLALEITGERLSLAQQRIERFQSQEHIR